MPDGPLTDDLQITLLAAVSFPETLQVGSRIELDCYDGGLLRVSGFALPVVLDLQALQTREQVKILLHHDPARPVGFVDEYKIGPTRLTASGKVTHADQAEAIAQPQREGFRWEASIGATVHSRELIQPGQQVHVNGRQLTGPFFLSRDWTWFETSFVGAGGGEHTHAKLLAAAPWGSNALPAPAEPISATDSRAVVPAITPPPQRKLPVPEPTQETTIARLEQQLQASIAQLEQQAARAKSLNEQLEQQLQAESRRNLLASVGTLCQQYELADAQKATLLASVGEGKLTSEADIEREVLRASYATHGQRLQPWQGKQGAPPSSAVLEASLLMTCGYDEKQLAPMGYDEATINAAIGQPASIKTIARHALRAQNHYADEIGERELQAAVEYALPTRLQASVSTISLPAILRNVMNKQLLAARLAVARVIPRISARGTTRDYKPISMVRLLPGGTLQPVGKNGEAKALMLAEDDYSNQARQYAGTLGLTEQMMVDDDLNAFAQLGQGFGQLSARTEEREGFRTLLSDIDTFWTVAKGNRLANGTEGAFSLTSLALADALFRDMSDGVINVEADTAKKDEPILMEPAIVLVTSGKRVEAMSIYNDTTLLVGDNKGNTKANPFKGQFEPLSSPYLSEGRFGNGTQWLLICDPAASAPLHTVYLDGRPNPRIKQWDRQPGKFAIHFDVDHTFGHALHDDRAAVYAKGKA